MEEIFEEAHELIYQKMEKLEQLEDNNTSELLDDL
jgi:hypothetical protein